MNKLSEAPWIILHVVVFQQFFKNLAAANM